MKPARPFWKIVRSVVLIGLIVFIAIQFIRPPLDNAPAVADWNAPPQVKAILQRACYDCHSNQTQLAWFDQPAPIYWLV
ncbi:MAG TPA: heme-binding domain-containing protein, partial [Puia sp.]